MRNVVKEIRSSSIFESGIKLIIEKYKEVNHPHLQSYITEECHWLLAQMNERNDINYIGRKCWELGQNMGGCLYLAIIL